MNRIERISAILIQLQSRQVVTAQAIADRFGISLRTVYRDIKSLNESGVPIIGEAGVGYSLVEGYKLPPVMFTNEEAVALLTAEKLLNKLTDKTTFEDFRSAMTKIRAILRASGQAYLAEVEDYIEVMENPQQSNELAESPPMQAILKGIATGRVLALQYFAAPTRQETRREVEPAGVFMANGRWYLLAFCRLRNDYRKFRLDRIRDVTITPQSFQKKHRSLKDYLENIPKQEQELHKIVVRTDHQTANYLNHQKYFMGFVSEESNGDSLEMTFLTAHLEGFARWYMFFGDKAELVGPPLLFQKIREQTERIQEKVNFSEIPDTLLT